MSGSVVTLVPLDFEPMVELPLVREAVRTRLELAIERLPADPADLLAWAVRNRLLIGLGVFALLAMRPLSEAVGSLGNGWAVAALVAVPAAYFLRNHRRLAALMLVLGGLILRLAVAHFWQADPIAVTVAAGQAALNGFNPYGHGFGASVPPGAPFPYGPLALLWDLPGQVVEFAASVATMILFVWTGSWVTLGFYAADSFAVHSATQGVNDLSPGLLLAVGFLLLRRRPLFGPLLGGVILAVAAAIKPYIFAWFPAAVGYAGLPAFVGLAGASAVLWSPLFDWGLGTYLKSVAMARAIHLIPNAWNVPELRILGLPLALAGFLVRRWEMAILSGTAVFYVVLFFDRWASQGYWLAVIPIAGIALEAWLTRRAARLSTTLRLATTDPAAAPDARLLRPLRAPGAGVLAGLASPMARQPIAADEPEPARRRTTDGSSGWTLGP